MSGRIANSKTSIKQHAKQDFRQPNLYRQDFTQPSKYQTSLQTGFHTTNQGSHRTQFDNSPPRCIGLSDKSPIPGPRANYTGLPCVLASAGTGTKQPLQNLSQKQKPKLSQPEGCGCRGHWRAAPQPAQGRALSTIATTESNQTSVKLSQGGGAFSNAGGGSTVSRAKPYKDMLT